MSVRQCISHVYKAEGVAGFYKGFAAPFLAQGLYKSVIFGCNNFISRYVFKQGNRPWQTMTSGAIAGAINSFVVCPVELIRSQQIIEHASSAHKSPSLISCASNVYRQHGVSGFFRGISSTILRDSIGLAVYFLTFVEIKKMFGDSVFVKLTAGAASGMVFWVVVLPIDTVKTIIQTAPIGSGTRSIQGVLQTLSEGRTSDGSSSSMGRGWGAVFKRLYSSLPIAVARGIPGAAITLTTYDVVSEALQK
jgi:hypothetical protein